MENVLLQRSRQWIINNMKTHKRHRWIFASVIVKNERVYRCEIPDCPALAYESDLPQHKHWPR